MTKLTQKGVKFDWGDKQEAAFQLLKQKLCVHQSLPLPEGSEDFIAYCDASKKGLGAVLMQRRKDLEALSVQNQNPLRGFGLSDDYWLGSSKQILKAHTEGTKAENIKKWDVEEVIKHEFWATAKAKTVKGEHQIQALIDKKKVIIMETSIRSDLHLEDTGGTDCLPTATIFEELARMGYGKPSQKLTFYKAFFSPQ
ncbi:putative reverse transcriptase domain-containing protein [Tanacetum coccineum]